MLGGDVDGDAHGRGPGHRFRAGAAQHPFADRPDQPRLFGQRDEFGGRDAAELRVGPAQQRFEALDRARLAGDDRLILKMQLVIGERAPQRDLQHAALLRVDMELRLVRLDRVAAHVLGLEQRQVGRTDQRLGGRAVARADRDAGAGADIKGVLVDVVGQRQLADDALGSLFQLGLIGAVLEDDAEFVAAQAPAEFVRAHQRLQPLRGAIQQQVADCMTQRVVHRLEAIEADDHQRAAAAPFVGGRQFVAQRFGDMEAVGQAGQRVVTRHAVDLVGGLALRRHVVAGAAIAAILAALVRDRRAGQLPPQRVSLHGDGQDDVVERCAVLDLLRDDAQRRREIACLPRLAGEDLQEGAPFQHPRVVAQRIGEAGRHAGQALVGVDLPLPVGIVIGMVEQFDTHALDRIGERGAGVAAERQPADVGEAARDQQRVERDRADRQDQQRPADLRALRRHADHDRQRQDRGKEDGRGDGRDEAGRK